MSVQNCLLPKLHPLYTPLSLGQQAFLHPFPSTEYLPHIRVTSILTTVPPTSPKMVVIEGRDPCNFYIFISRVPCSMNICVLNLSNVDSEEVLRDRELPAFRKVYVHVSSGVCHRRTLKR